MSDLRVVVVGSGAREHALACAMAAHAEVFVTPGNPGMEFEQVKSLARVDADLYVIGPEQPLVDGLADRLRAQGKLVLGPGADGAMLEGSKAWMKAITSSAGIPTADYRVVSDTAGMLIAVQDMITLYGGCVVKTDGLAAGKGVFVTHQPELAILDAQQKLDGTFGDAGKTLVIEQPLESNVYGGAYEVSIFAICNGSGYVLLEGAQDYKLLERGSSINTGGMGAYSPTRDQHKLLEWADLTIKPLLAELKRCGIDYRGILYAGLMIVDGEPYLLEYNIRMGDPEAQAVLPRVTSNLVTTFMQAAAGEPMDQVWFSSDCTIATVLASAGYPKDPKDGFVISGIEAARKVPGTRIFFGGVDVDEQSRLITKGGRVLTVVTRGDNPAEVKSRNNKAVALIDFAGKQSRADIGKELLETV